MKFLRKYGEATTITFGLRDTDGVLLKSDAVYAAGDVKISKDEGADTNIDSGFVDEGLGYSMPLTDTEMEAARIQGYIEDQGSPVWLGREFTIETYGHANAQYEVFPADIKQISGDSTAADNLESQFDGTGITGGTFPGTQDQLSGLANVGSAINRPAASYTLTTGTQSANTYTATEALDGTNHEHEDDGGVLDLYYEFNIGAGFASSVQVTGYVQGVNDDVDVYGYDWVAAGWVQIGNIQGSALASNQVNSFDMFVDMVGSGANQGVVRVQFYKASGLTSATLAIDQIFTSFNQTAEGYQNAAIWFNSNASNTNTVKGIDGTSTNPVSTMAAVNTLLASTNLSRVEVASGSTITLGATQNNQVFNGINWDIDWNGQDIAGSSFIGADISGAVSGTGTEQVLKDCHLLDVTHLKNTHMVTCAIEGTQTASEAGDYHFDRCRSSIAASGTWVFDFGAAVGDTNLNWRNGSGGVQLENMGDTGTDLATIEGRGQLIEGTCTGGIVAVRGAFTTSGITNLTLIDDARYDLNKIIDDPVNGLAEMLVAIKTRLASIPYATEHPPATVTVNNGTVLDGNVDSLQTLNQVYLKVQETGQFTIDTTYTNIEEEHDRFYATYRYFGAGSSNHKVEAKMWNYDTSAWDDVIATDKDFPATDEDRTIIFDVPGNVSDYYTGSIPTLSAQLRIEHVSNNNSAHEFWLDTIGVGDLEIIYSAPDNAGIAAIEAVAGKHTLQTTSIDTLTSQTVFTILEGSADENAYNNALLVITDATTAEQKAMATVLSYEGATKEITLESDPGIYTMAIGDMVDIIANQSTAALINAVISEKVDTLLDINKPQDLVVNTTTTLAYQWLDTEGDPVDISALTFKFKAVQNAGEASPAIPEVTGTITDGANGRWEFDVLPTTVFKGRYEIWADDGAGVITPLTIAGGVRIETHPRL